MSKQIKITDSSSKKKDKAPIASQPPLLEEDLFQALNEYHNNLQMIPEKVELVKSLHYKLLAFTHLPLVGKIQVTKILLF